MPRDGSPTPDFKDAARREGNGINSPLDERGRTALHISVEKGDMVAAVKLLGMHAHPNRADKLGQTPLYEAITARNLHMVNLLLERGATFRVEDNEKRTPLMWAIEQGCDIQFLEQLRRLGLSLEARNAHGCSAVHAAVIASRPDVISYLVRGGVPVDASDGSGISPLHLAAERRAHGCMRQLLSLGADPLLRTNEIKTALYIAAASGDEVAVNILLAIPDVKQTINDFKTYSEGHTPLMAAVAANHLAIVRKLIDLGADLNLQDNQNCPSLFIAMAAGHVEMAKLLISCGADVEKVARPSADRLPAVHYIHRDCYQELLLILHAAGADLNAVNGTGHTALHYAANLGDEKMVGVLLDLGADPNIADSLGRRPLDLIMEQLYYMNNPKLVKMLLDHGARAGLSSFAAVQNAPLHAAARYGHEEIARLLLIHNAFADEQDRGLQGATPFLVAVEYGHQNIARLLLEKGADALKKDKYLRNALHFAACQDSAESLGSLLEIEGLAQEIDAQDNGGMTPLHEACRMERVACAELLIRRGANPWLHDEAGLTPVHHAAMANNTLLLAAFEKVVDSSANWNVRSRDEGETPLHTVAKGGLQGMTEQLLALGADVFAKNAQGMTPLHLAIMSDQGSVAHVLIAHIKAQGGDLSQNCDGNGWTPLHHAAARPTQQMASFLLSAGIDVNIRTPQGDTPLHIAAHAGQRGIVDYLISKGADINAVNAAGKTPLDMARLQKHDSVVEAFVEILRAQKNAQPSKPAGKSFRPPSR